MSLQFYLSFVIKTCIYTLKYKPTHHLSYDKGFPAELNDMIHTAKKMFPDSIPLTNVGTLQNCRSFTASSWQSSGTEQKYVLCFKRID